MEVNTIKRSFNEIMNSAIKNAIGEAQKRSEKNLRIRKYNEKIKKRKNR